MPAAYRSVIPLLVLIATLAVNLRATGREMPSWLPESWQIAEGSISPDGHYGVILPEQEGNAPSKLVEMKDGKVVATMAGDYGGWSDHSGFMRWGGMEAAWSADGSVLCWIFPGKWFPNSCALVKIHDGKPAWQIELMRTAQVEILTRTQEAAPLNFAAAKLSTDGNGSAYPEGFSIVFTEPKSGFLMPLVCDVFLTSNIKESENEPEENGIRAWLKMKIDGDGSVHFSDFKVKQGRMTAADIKRTKEAMQKRFPLIDTDTGKALLFQGMTSKDGRYAMGWTVRPTSGAKAVDWSQWDEHDSDKLLRHYDWGQVLYSGRDTPYRVVDMVIDLHSGKTMELPTDQPYWTRKTDAWAMTTRWMPSQDGKHFGLVEIGAADITENLWLVNADKTQLRQTDLVKPMQKAVNEVLREKRPMEPDPSIFMVSYDIPAVKEPDRDSVIIPFRAEYPSSNKRNLGLHGTVTVNLAEGKVTQALSNAKLIAPFENNAELKKADNELNALYRDAMKSMPPEKAAQLKEQQRAWIKKRDADAEQAVNVSNYKFSPEQCEQVREKSLLGSTNARIVEFQKLATGGKQQ